MLRKISPANGYCLFFPGRPKGKRVVAGRSVWVGPLEEWKQVKLGLFTVLLPGDQPMLITTSEKLECDLKASFGIVVGGPLDGQEERLEQATGSCAAGRSLAEKIELVPFFRDWAANHCRTAILNTVGECEYVRLFEESKYRTEVQQKVEAAARKTLEQIGLLLVQCTVVIEPREPKGVFATPDILEKWRDYKQSINVAERAKLSVDYEHEKQQKTLENEHKKNVGQLTEQEKQNQATLDQETEFKLRELALELKQKEASLAIQEQKEIDQKDREIGQIQEDMAKRAQELQLNRIKREAELEQERERQQGKLAALRREQEQTQIEHRKKMLAEEKAVYEKEVELLTLKEQVSAADVALEQRKGEVRTQNLEREVLAKGAHEMRMRQFLFQSLPNIVEQAAKPAEKIGSIKVLSLSGGQAAELGAQSSVGSVIASASALPVIREVFQFLRELEHSPINPLNEEATETTGKTLGR